MRSKTLTLVALLVGLLATPAAAQDLAVKQWDLTALYDLDSASFIYCNSRGLGRAMVQADKQPPNNASRLTTAGASSTTVTCTACFTNVAVGDILYIQDATPLPGVPPAGTLKRVVTARASANSITINSAITVTNAPFSYRTPTCGTGDTDGAIPVDGMHSFLFQIDIDQEVSTSIDYQMECRTRGALATWLIVSGPTNQTGTGRFYISTDLPWGECRIGLKMNTDDGDDLTTNAEQIDVSFIGRQ